MARFIRKLDERKQHDEADPILLFTAASADQKQKSKDGGGEEESSEEGGGQKNISKKGEDLKEDMDSLLDEIDSVLEENAEEFVKNYVQRGGQ